MNQLENWQARYRSNTWISRTHTDGSDEIEPSKFDCIKHIRQDYHWVPWVMPKGLGLGGAGGQKI